MGHQTTEFLLRHGYGVVFAWVFAEQMGIPVPALPLLLAAGASAGRGHLSFSVLLVLATIAAALSDSIWYYVGRRKGSKVLNLLCRVSLEPDSCVRNTQNLFTRRGANSLLIAKFVPGLGTVSMPLAGIYPQELKRLIDDNQPVIVVDLRNQLAMEGEPMRIPGAIRFTPEELEQRHHEIPRDQDVVLYCT